MDSQQTEGRTMPKILAIDDKENTLITISDLLKDFISDCTVLTCDSGEEGIKIAQKNFANWKVRHDKN